MNIAYVAINTPWSSVCQLFRLQWDSQVNEITEWRWGPMVKQKVLQDMGLGQDSFITGWIVGKKKVSFRENSPLSNSNAPIITKVVTCCNYHANHSCWTKIGSPPSCTCCDPWHCICLSVPVCYGSCHFPFGSKALLVNELPWKFSCFKVTGTYRGNINPNSWDSMVTWEVCRAHFFCLRSKSHWQVKEKRNGRQISGYRDTGHTFNKKSEQGTYVIWDPYNNM